MEGNGAVALRTFALTKRYGRLTAVDGLEIEIHRGEVFGLLGPNGAGKSTTIGISLGLIRPTTGRVEILGRDVWRERERALRQVGAIAEVPAFYPYLSGRDNLRALAIARGSGDERIDPLLERVGLASRARSKVATYSLGMRQRLGIASTLLVDPALVILDEPANGLDPAGQREVRELIRSLAAEGRGVLLASHLLHEVEQICDRVAVIHRGRLLEMCPVKDLLRRAGHFQVEVADTDGAAALLRGLPFVERVEKVDGGLRVAAAADQGSAISRALAQGGIYPSALVPRTSSLEEVFLELTEPGGRDDQPAA